MIQFIRLTRPINLIVIALTMYGFGWYLEEQIVSAEEIGIKTSEFFLLVLSTTMIAAAGNIINDYFDIRADRVNKPERLIIGKHIKRRVGIVTHWVINMIAFMIAIYLSLKLNTFWYVFIHLLSINVLWFYSSYFKRRFLLGNILVAGLTALVPLLVGLYYYLHDNVTWSMGRELYPFQWYSPAVLIIYLSVGLAVFAFILNLAREISKDIQDVEGDLLLRAKTIPIVWGVKRSTHFLTLILALGIVAVTLMLLFFPISDFMAFIPVYISLFCVTFSIVLSLIRSTEPKVRSINLCLKIAMIFGILSPVWWQILKMYG